MDLNIDSLLVVNAIEECKISNMECVALLRDIQRLIKEHDIVIVSHTYMDTNRCANALANIGYLGNHFRIYDEAHVNLRSILDKDFLGLLPLKVFVL